MAKKKNRINLNKFIQVHQKLAKAGMPDSAANYKAAEEARKDEFPSDTVLYPKKKQK